MSLVAGIALQIYHLQSMPPLVPKVCCLGVCLILLGNLGEKQQCEVRKESRDLSFNSPHFFKKFLNPVRSRSFCCSSMFSVEGHSALIASVLSRLLETFFKICAAVLPVILILSNTSIDKQQEERIQITTSLD